MGTLSDYSDDAVFFSAEEVSGLAGISAVFERLFGEFAKPLLLQSSDSSKAIMPTLFGRQRSQTGFTRLQAIPL